jgi:hypothetical protein
VPGRIYHAGTGKMDAPFPRREAPRVGSQGKVTVACRVRQDGVRVLHREPVHPSEVFHPLEHRRACSRPDVQIDTFHQVARTAVDFELVPRGVAT